MSERVFAVVSVYENVELVPHFLAHYTRLGVHRVLLPVRSRERDELYENVARHAEAFPASAYWFAADHFADADKSSAQALTLATNGVEPDDYVMHVDLDEFHEYPAPLPEIVRGMNQRGDRAL